MQLGINHGSAQHIVHDVLQYHKMCARGVPRQLTSELKVQHMNACKEHMGHCQTEGGFCLQCIVTGDESWAHFFQPGTKRASQEWQHPNSPKPKKFCAQLSVGRVMLHCSGTVRGRFWSITLLGDHKHPSYCGLLVNHQKPEIWSKCQWLLTTGVLLLHDDAWSRMAFSMVAEIIDLHFECLLHSPYSTDLAPSDFHMFGTLK